MNMETTSEKSARISLEKHLMKIKALKTEKGWSYKAHLYLTKEHVYQGKIHVKLNEVRSLTASNLGLTSLENFPKIVHKDLKINHNCLTDFNNSPIEEVKGLLFVNDNNLTSLKNSPKKVRDIYLYNNLHLKNLKYCPICTSLSSTRDFFRSGSGTRIIKLEFDWHDNCTDYNDVVNRDLNLLKYVLKNYGDKPVLIEACNFPENFVTDNLKNSILNVNKFNL